ncbi:SABRE-like protein [Drosera capensis]
MAAAGASPAKFLFRFLFFSIVVWIVFIFIAKMIALFLSRVIGASVRFRVGGWKCLRDVVVKFRKGAIESISVGEVRVSIRQSLVRLGVGFLSRDPKLQMLICDLEIVMRPLTKGTKKTSSRKPRSSGKGIWVVIANVATFLSVSVTDLVFKTRKATFEVKQLKVDLSKDGSTNLLVKLLLSPIVAHMDPAPCNDEPSLMSSEGCDLPCQSSAAQVEKAPASLICEELSVSCKFGHVREAGVVVKDVDLACGNVTVTLNEEFQKSKKSSTVSDALKDSSSVHGTEKIPSKKQGMSSVTKVSTVFPEKVSFDLPNLDVKYVHQGHNLVVENHIKGIQLRSTKSRFVEDVGESTRLDLQLDLSEIHLLRDAESSILEILKVNVISTIYVPLQPSKAIRAEIDVKLGGTQCHVMVSRLVPWMRLHFSKEKKMVLKEEAPGSERPKSTGSKAIMWTCTVSAPEMTVMLYSITGSPLFQGCSQSSHVFANNISNPGTSIHAEFGEFNLHLADEYSECMKDSLFSMETNSGSLVHIARFSLDMGKKEEDTQKQDDSRSRQVLSVDVSGMGVYFTMKRIESLIVTAISLQTLFKRLKGPSKKSQGRAARSSKSSGKGTQLLKLNLERCSINYQGDVGLENTIVEDPKRVNYGSQGGRVLITTSADGTPRSAYIVSTVSDECKKLKYSVSLEIFHLSVCVNTEKQSTQVELERARSVYQEHPEQCGTSTKVLLLDMQNAKFVRRSGGLKEVAVCSLFSATDIAVRWEPDVHIALFELMLYLKLLVHSEKQNGLHEEQLDGTVRMSDSSAVKEEGAAEAGTASKLQKKAESVFAVDVEMLRISAEAGDGVEVLVQVESIFSENARIGVLLEGLMLSFNDATVFRSSRMQISRIPNTSVAPDSTAITTWDWVIQGLDVLICMPYRLELRAIDDSIEDMLRALKLITASKTKLIFQTKNSKPKKKSSSKFGCLKFCIRKLTAEIEEEPLQGWLDEHYQLMKNEACELAVRLKFLERLASRTDSRPDDSDTNDSTLEQNLINNAVDMDLQDPSVVSKLQEDIYKQSFRSYYQACQKLIPSEGSGACRNGFQAGFRFSTTRTSLLSLTATNLDLSLLKIEGGEAGMVEVVKALDPVAKENDIPFSKLYGSNIVLQSRTLVVQLRDYSFPLLGATGGKCEGRLVLAQQATCFQPQIRQDVYVGRWRKVNLLRSASGTTPGMKTYLDIPICFEKGEVSFGVSYEPPFADISYAFTVALRRANLSVRNPNATLPQSAKKEKSLPWWDEVRNYVHGSASLFFNETNWYLHATTDPYEKLNKLQILTGYMEIKKSDGRVFLLSRDFNILTSSMESLAKDRCVKIPNSVSYAFLEAPVFTLEVNMDWNCESGQPLNHYLYALPVEGVPREKVLDPFRSTSLSLRWNFSLRPAQTSSENHQQSCNEPPTDSVGDMSGHCPTVKVGAHDFAWIIKFWALNYLPPHKLRSFSRWPRFGVPRVPRSGNLSLDRVMTEFMLRIDATPACIKHMPLDNDDPAKGLTFTMAKLKYELCFSRGKQKFTFECKRDTFDLVYQAVDLHMPKAYLVRQGCTSDSKTSQITMKNSQSASTDKGASEKSNSTYATESHGDDGFLLSSDYFTIRKQAPKADPARLLLWQEAGRRNVEMTYVRSEFENGSDSDEHIQSDPSDDDGYNVVIADNCRRVFVYGLKLLWTIENRDAVWSWVGGLSKAFSPPKPSPSRQYAQRKLLEERQKLEESGSPQVDVVKAPIGNGGNSSSPQNTENVGSVSSPSHSVKVDSSAAASTANNGKTKDSEEEGTRHFMVNVIEPQFNLHSAEANGRFLLAAVSGRVLARSFHSILSVGHEMISKALGSGNVPIPDSQPEMTWNRMEFSVMLERVQAHVAPTDVDPGAGIQWLPKIQRNSPKVKRTGALLERVFMPCDMYFRYTRHKGGNPDLKVKPLKELAFNSHNITATMTSRQFQVMLDVLTNLLFARLPKPRKSSLSLPSEDDEDIEEEADEVVPDGVEEVELAKINLEHKERELKLLLGDLSKLSVLCDDSGDHGAANETDLWMVTDGQSALVQKLKVELGNVRKSRKVASASLRMTLQKAAQLRLMEKEKNKSPSYAMRISLQINKVVWSMLVDGKAFAEAEINDMIYDFDRDYKDVGVARFTTKYLVLRNCLPNAKSDMLLSAWNPPSEWGKKVMLRVDAKQGAPKDGSSPLELFQVDIYPLKIHLTETMYRMMWEYLFPEEEQDSLRRQEVWKVSTTAGLKRVKKGSSVLHEGSSSVSQSAKDSEGSSKSGASGSTHADSLQGSTLSLKLTGGSSPKLRRTSSFDKTWEESVAESVANELMLQVHSSGLPSVGANEQQDDSLKGKSKDPKLVKPGRPSHEEKKTVKPSDEKKPRKMMEFHNIKIGQVELLVTYEGSRFAVSDLRLLMDTFHRVEFTGTWRRLFSRVKKHIIWGVLKSVTGMQGKKFKDKAHSQREATAPAVPDDLNLSDSDGGQAGKSDQVMVFLPKRAEGAGDGFVTSIRGLFSSQRRKAKAFVLRTMRGEGENEFHGDWSGSDTEFSPFARQLTITKAKKLIRRHTKKFRSRTQKAGSSQQRDSLPSSPKETTIYETDSSSGSSPYEDFHE